MIRNKSDVNYNEKIRCLVLLQIKDGWPGIWKRQKEKYNCSKFQYDYCIIPGATLLQEVTHSIEPTCASFDVNAELKECNSVIGILDVDVTTG